MKKVKLTILIGSYAQRYYLDEPRNYSVTEFVKGYKKYLPVYLPLVHPSPRNKLWQKNNPWFKTELVPVLQTMVREII